MIVGGASVFVANFAIARCVYEKCMYWYYWLCMDMFCSDCVAFVETLGTVNVSFFCGAGGSF